MCTTPAISNELCLNLLVGGYGLTKFSLFGDPVSVVFRRNIEFKSLEPFEGDIFYWDYCYSQQWFPFVSLERQLSDQIHSMFFFFWLPIPPSP